ncbi:glycosyltransferase [uncultured Polaribacter sp.]|uniref:glycosyltransferase n=1 Tax=uncultured Polaribacter sp. TaxID=174711 RepID=UPI00260A2F0B|nr:glycosyltransferase [uncultured Polaribacter sp.]
MSKIGVIQIIDSLNTGGAEVLAVNIANLLVKENINSHLCVTRQEGKLRESINKNTGYLFLNKKRTIDIKAIITFKNYIKANNISILHAHSSSFFLAFCVKLICPKLKIIWHDHFGKTQELKKRNIFPLKQISFFFKGIIAVNNQLEKWSLHNLYCKRVYLLNNFAVFNNFEKHTILEGIEGKRIVHLGAFRAQKDHENLINAFHLFQKDFKEWSLHLIGGYIEDTYYKKIKRMISEKGLEKHIFVHGVCTDIFNILQQCSLGVLSSKSEGLPIALLEYGLAKLPVVVTNVGDCNKVIVNNKTGFIIMPNNSTLLADKLKQLANSKKLSAYFGQNLNIQIKNNFSQENFMKQVLHIYKS